MIATFILKEVKSDVFLSRSILDINPNGFVNQGDVFNNLKLAIEWAISNEEDVIYCVCGNDFRNQFQMEHLNKIIIDIASEGIFSLYIDAGYEEFINVNDSLVAISGINSVSSFVIVKPIYRVVLSFLSEISDYPEMGFLNFIKLIIPNSFMYLENNNVAVESNKIHIISPFRNAAIYLDNYFSSIIKQHFTNFDVTLIDDCSTDNSFKKIPNLPFVKKNVNYERKFALRNLLDILIRNENFEDDDIICLIDGDDMLPHKYVLNIINDVYNNKSTLITYGTMSYFGCTIKRGIPYNKHEFEKLRESTWKALPLRTFKYKVFRKLLELDKNLDCFKDKYGSIFRMPADMALFFSLMEIAGYDNVKFVDTPTYKYRLHEYNDHHKYRKEQYAGEIEVRRKSGFKCMF